MSENPKKNCHQDHKCIKEAVNNTLQKVSYIIYMKYWFHKIIPHSKHFLYYYIARETINGSYLTSVLPLYREI